MDHAGAKQSGRRDGDVEHGGFNTDLGLSTIHDERDFVAKGFQHMIGIGGRKLVGDVGAGRGEWKVAGADHCLNEWMAGPANTHSLASGGNEIRNSGGTWQDDAKWPRPKGGGQFVSKRRPV